MLHAHPNVSVDWGARIGAGGLCKRPRPFEIGPVSICRIYSPVRYSSAVKSAPMSASPSSVRGVQDQMEYVIKHGHSLGRFPAGHTGTCPLVSKEGSTRKKGKWMRLLLPHLLQILRYLARARRRLLCNGPCITVGTQGQAPYVQSVPHSSTAPPFDHLRGTARTGVSWDGRGCTRTHVPKYRGIRPRPEAS